MGIKVFIDIYKIVKNGDLEALKENIDSNILDIDKKFQLIVIAATSRHLNIVQYLIDHWLISFSNDYFIYEASYNINLIKYFLNFDIIKLSAIINYIEDNKYYAVDNTRDLMETLLPIC